MSSSIDSENEEIQSTSTTTSRKPSLRSNWKSYLWLIRIAAYFIAVIAAYKQLSPILGNRATTVTVILIVFLALINLPNAEEGLAKVLTDVTDAFEQAKTSGILDRMQSVIEKPWLHFSPTSILKPVYIWHLSLMQSIRFATHQYHQFSEENTQSIVETIISLFLLLLLVAYSVPLFAPSFSPREPSRSDPLRTLLALTIFFGTPALEILVRYGRGPKRAELQRSYIPGILWFFITGLWLLPMFDWQSLQGINMIMGTFSWGMILGCVVGVTGNATSERSKSDWAIFYLAVATLIAGAAASDFAVIPQPREFQAQVETNPILGPVYRFYEEQGIHTEYSEALPPGATFDREPDYGMSLPLTVITYAFFSSLVGFAVGQLGIVLLLIEAPIFYLSWLRFQTRNHDPKRNDSEVALIQRIVNLDDWRAIDWLGISEAYQQIRHAAPSEFVLIIAPQVFTSARRSSALNRLSSFVTDPSMDPEVIVEALVPLLPFEQYEASLPEVTPRISVLVSANLAEDFELIYERRRKVFSDLLKCLPDTVPFVACVPALNALKTIAEADWDEREQARVDASTIRSGLMDYKGLLHIRGLFLLSVALEKSLAVRDYRQIASTIDAWQDFKGSTAHDPRLKHLEEYARVLRDFARISAELSDSAAIEVETVLMKASLQYISLQEQLKSDKMNGQIGIREVNLVINHWGTHLRALVRTHS